MYVLWRARRAVPAESALESHREGASALRAMVVEGPEHIVLRDLAAAR